MKKFFKENWKFLLFATIIGAIGGYFTASYMYGTLTDEMLQQLQEQNVTKDMLIGTTTIQVSLLYGLLLSILGIILSKKIGLWKEFKIEKKPLIITLIIGAIGGLVLYPGDYLLFGSIDIVKEAFTTKPTIEYFLMSITYGGVIEEIMIRLFFMSLVIFIISKIFCKNKKEIPVKVYIISNIIAAIAFAAGHIPSTAVQTAITPLVLIRCFSLNSLFGIGFGYLYRKHGIHYSMLCHGMCHFISKILMFIFI